MRELYNYRIDETYSPTTKKELQGFIYRRIE